MKVSFFTLLLIGSPSGVQDTQKSFRLPDGGLEVRLFVELNQELDAKILEFGKDATVIEPPLLRDRIRENLQQALNSY